MTIIPALNIPITDTVKLINRLESVRNATPVVHLDVCNGTLTPNKTWSDAKAWPAFGRDIELQVHLMVEYPEWEIDDWLIAGAKHIVVHLESLVRSLARPTGSNPAELLTTIGEQCRAASARLFLAGMPGTSGKELAQYAEYVDGFLVLSVDPGFAGQSFKPASLEVIKELREACPYKTIYVDGGVNKETIVEARLAGASAGIAASAVFETNEDPPAAINTLQSM